MNYPGRVAYSDRSQIFFFIYSGGSQIVPIIWVSHFNTHAADYKLHKPRPS